MGVAKHRKQRQPVAVIDRVIAPYAAGDVPAIETEELIEFGPRKIEGAATRRPKIPERQHCCSFSAHRRPSLLAPCDSILTISAKASSALTLKKGSAANKDSAALICCDRLPPVCGDECRNLRHSDRADMVAALQSGPFWSVCERDLPRNRRGIAPGQSPQALVALRPLRRYRCRLAAPDRRWSRRLARASGVRASRPVGPLFGSSVARS